MKYYIVLIFIGLTIITMGQQLPQSTFFVYDQMTINPGYAGSQEGICVNVLARNQWMGFEGAPNTQKFDVHLPFKLFGFEHGAGFSLYNDKIGFDSDINATLSYSFIKSVGNGKLGIGIGAGMLSQTLDGTWAAIDNTSDPLIPSTSAKGTIAFALNLGAYYRTNSVFLGLSLMNLNAGKISAKVDAGKLEYAHLVRQFNITAGYNYQLSNPLFEIQPAVIISSVLSSTQISVNTTLRYRGRFWGGVGYRHTDAITTFVGASIIEGLNVGLSYDITTSKIAKYDDGSIEIFLRYVFKMGVTKEYDHYKSIRYL